MRIEENNAVQIRFEIGSSSDLTFPATLISDGTACVREFSQILLMMNPGISINIDLTVPE
jgi:hypothetical protein